MAKAFCNRVKEVLAFSPLFSLFASRKRKAAFKSSASLLNLQGEITYRMGSGQVKYRFIRSDGKKIPYRKIYFENPGKKKIFMEWKIMKTFSGWMQIEVLFPERIKSNRANFTVVCTEGKKKAELRGFLKFPKNLKAGQKINDRFFVMIKNSGEKEAKDFNVDIILYEKGKNKRIFCGKGYVPFVDPHKSTFPINLNISIPENLKEGRYFICAITDPDNKIMEANEKNNLSCQEIRITAKQ